MNAVRSNFAATLAWVALALGLVPARLASAVAHTTIWLAADPGRVSDYSGLFSYPERWQQASADVSVFKTSSQFILAAPDSVLHRMFDQLRHLNIRLAVEGLMLTASRPCGFNVEGYGGKTMQLVAERIKKLGGTLDYVAMDEPLWFGHEYNGPQACRSTLQEIAADVAHEVAMLKGYFPAVEVGDIEPVANPGVQNWTKTISEWLSVYRAEVGEPLAFLHVDVNWLGDWRRQIHSVSSICRAAGTKFGIIYNGDWSARTGLEWTNLAEKRFLSVERDPALVPEQAVLQSWMPQPDHMLPDSAPGTMTNFVLRYAARQTRLTARVSETLLQGHLETASGAPLSGQRIQLFSAAQRPPTPLPSQTMTGRVPDGAVRALVGLRVNAECGCDGTAVLAIGAMQFRDEQTRTTVIRRFFPQKASSALRGRMNLVVAEGQHILFNTAQFGVSEGHKYAFTADVFSDYEGARNAHLTLIFLDRSGQELARKDLVLREAISPVQAVVTDKNGDFAIQLEAKSAEPGLAYVARYEGNSAYRPDEAYTSLGGVAPGR